MGEIIYTVHLEAISKMDNKTQFHMINTKIITTCEGLDEVYSVFFKNPELIKGEIKLDGLTAKIGRKSGKKTLKNVEMEIGGSGDVIVFVNGKFLGTIFSDGGIVAHEVGITAEGRIFTEDLVKQAKAQNLITG